MVLHGPAHSEVYDPDCNKEEIPCQRWFCMKRPEAKIKVKCVDWGVHETEGAKAVFDLTFLENKQTHRVWLYRVSPLEECLELKNKILKTLRKKTKNERYCFYADYNGITQDEENVIIPKMPKQIHNWRLWSFMANGIVVTD